MQKQDGVLSTQWRMIKPQNGNSETHCNLGKLESVMLNEISQSQEKYHVTSPMGGPHCGQIYSPRIDWWAPGTDSRFGDWGTGISGHSQFGKARIWGSVYRLDVMG